MKNFRVNNFQNDFPAYIFLSRTPAKLFGVGTIRLDLILKPTVVKMKSGLSLWSYTSTLQAFLCCYGLVLVTKSVELYG